MTSRRTVGSLALALLVQGASGCSYLFMERAPEVVAAPEYPVHCTSSRAAPIIDTIYAASAGLEGVLFAVMPTCGSTPDEGCVDSGTKAALVALSAVEAAVVAVAAKQGFDSAKRCERVKDLNARCITGREDACRALNSSWTPSRRAPATEWQPAGPGAPPVDAPVPGVPGCTKDVDCKGTRVCERGVCVEPGARPAP